MGFNGTAFNFGSLMVTLLFRGKSNKSFMISNKFYFPIFYQNFASDFEFLMIHDLMVKLYFTYKVDRVGP